MSALLRLFPSHMIRMKAFFRTPFESLTLIVNNIQTRAIACSSNLPLRRKLRAGLTPTTKPRTRRPGFARPAPSRKLRFAPLSR